MIEREWQNKIVRYAQKNGWRVWHVPTPMRPTAGGKFVPDSRGRGLPDLLMIHPGASRLIFAEVKKTGGVLSDGQVEFLKMMRSVCNVSSAVEAYVWFPEHWTHVQRILEP